MPTDLTAILIPKGQLAESDVAGIVGLSRADVLLRMAPLEAVGLVQIEVCDAVTGLPCAAPELVAALSEHGRATFLHVNHEAKQAFAHTFARGQAEESFAGEPGERMETELERRVGVRLQALLDADDGTRLGIGIAASRSTCMRGGEVLIIPIGTPTGLNSFSFHDGGRDSEKGGLRMALFAYRADVVAAALDRIPCGELAQKIEAAPAGSYGPLEGLREEVTRQLRSHEATELSESESQLRVRAHELAAFGDALVFAGGEPVAYWDERMLPVFSLSEGAPVIDRDDVAELAACRSILDAMVEVLPFAAPPGGEGTLVASISDEAVRPLVDLFSPSGEYEGAVFGLLYRELLERVRTLDGEKLSAMIARFERVWYETANAARPKGRPSNAFVSSWLSGVSSRCSGFLAPGRSCARSSRSPRPTASKSAWCSMGDGGGDDGTKRAVGYEVLNDERVGEGFLCIRQLRLRVVFDDGSMSKEGRWDFVERPMGRDAVVLAIYRRLRRAQQETLGAEERVEVLLRESLRVPLAFGRQPGPVDKGRYPGHPIVELVAGVLEQGEDDLDGIQRRAAAEAHEEAGLSVAPEKIVLLGAPMWASPGIFAERFFVACELESSKAASASIPAGDGSPFEEGALLFWLPIEEAIARSTRGELDDLKTELGLRRLKEHLG